MPAMREEGVRPLIVADVHGLKGQSSAERSVYAERTFQLATDSAQRDQLASAPFARDEVVLTPHTPPSYVLDAAHACASTRTAIAATSANSIHEQVLHALADPAADPSRSTAWLPLFEVLQRHAVFPASVADATARALGPRPPTAPPATADASPGAACVTLHLGASDDAHVAACARFMAQHRPALFWEWQGVPAGAAAATALRADAESRWAPLSSSSPDELTSIAVRHLTAVITSLCHCTGVPGVLLATARAPVATPPAAALAQCCAAVATLAAGGSFIYELPAVASPLTLSASAFCGRYFGDVSLFRPAAMPAHADGVFLVAQRFAPPGLAALSALVDTLAALEMSTVGRDGLPLAEYGFLAEAAVPEELRLSWEDACGWAERRAGSDAVLARSLQDTEVDAQRADVAQRWVELHGAAGLTAAKAAEWQSQSSGWLPARHLYQHPAPATWHPHASPVVARGHKRPRSQELDDIVAPPSHNPDAPDLALHAARTAVALAARSRAAEAHATAAHGQQEGGGAFSGLLQTYHERKGWERVARLRSAEWPTHVEKPECVPNELRWTTHLMVAGFAAKPHRIATFWPVHASPADGAALQGFLAYLAKHSASLGRARMAVIKPAREGGGELGLVAGSGREAGSMVAIMFTRTDAQ